LRRICNLDVGGRLNSPLAYALTNVTQRLLGPLSFASTAYSNIAQSASKAGLAVAGTVADLITSAVGMALSRWDIAKGVQQLDKSERAVNDILEKHVGYEIHLEFGPDPDLLPAGL
jgi:hypothetical protein